MDPPQWWIERDVGVRRLDDRAARQGGTGAETNPAVTYQTYILILRREELTQQRYRDRAVAPDRAVWVPPAP
jgi:hypothetical protein